MSFFSPSILFENLFVSLGLLAFMGALGVLIYAWAFVKKKSESGSSQPLQNPNRTHRFERILNPAIDSVFQHAFKDPEILIDFLKAS